MDGIILIIINISTVVLGFVMGKCYAQAKAYYAMAKMWERISETKQTPEFYEGMKFVDEVLNTVMK